MLDSIRTGQDELVRIRRDIHRHPELGFQEVRTSAIIARYLSALGIEVHDQIAGTGLVGLIKGRTSGRTIGLRADMDALPMTEATGLDYSSVNPGTFHGCGHDGHVAMLLGAARYLAGARDFAGTAALIFQPAEEGLGGARRMIAEGLFDRFACDEIYALHNSPLDGFGTVGVWDAVSHAGADFFDIVIRGTGAHAATPHRGRDPILMATALVQSMQSVVAMNSDAFDPLVISVTRIEAGSAYNVIPQDAVIAGTIRYLDETNRDLAHTRLQALARGLAAAYEVEVEVDFQNRFDIVVNDRACAAVLETAASHVVGPDKVQRHQRPIMGSEDFGDMLRRVPGAFCIVGHGSGVAVHNPGFLFDDDIIPVGASVLAGVALQQLRA